MRNVILCGDVREQLRELEDESVNCCVTSPPYWGLRDYGTAQWEGGDAGCDHKAPTANKVFGNPAFNENRPSREATATAGYREACGKCGARRIDAQFGLEPTPEEYVANMVDVFREVRRVLRKDATLWLNLGDSYASTPVGTFNGGGFRDTSSVNGGRNLSGIANGSRQSKVVAGLKPKDLVGIPWRVAFALQADGWWLRSDIIWSKPNPMPESVTDRPTKAHEYLFLLSKSERYYYDAEAIKEGLTASTIQRYKSGWAGDEQRGYPNGPQNHFSKYMGSDAAMSATGRNRRTVWEIATEPYEGAHFATFPTELVKPCILAGCPEGGVVLDPFFGSGTTGLVAKTAGRDYIGIELNPAYVQLAERRICVEQERLL